MATAAWTLDELKALTEEQLAPVFEKAVKIVRETPESENPTSTEQKLKVYGLFKQANFGDNTEASPWAVQFEKKAKWEAWNSQKGKSKADAMIEYIMEVKPSK